MASLVLFSACAGSGPSVNIGDKDISDANEGEYTLSSDLNLDLDIYRSNLSDRFRRVSNEIPEELTKVIKDTNTQNDPYQGYRIQIFSGHNISDADTIAAKFRAWSDTTLSSYQPETYVFFKTPYYKVHVGDFHNRDRAITLSEIIKRNFKDAWVVYDRVQPDEVPADSIKFIDPDKSDL